MQTISEDVVEWFRSSYCAREIAPLGCRRHGPLPATGQSYEIPLICGCRQVLPSIDRSVFFTPKLCLGNEMTDGCIPIGGGRQQKQVVGRSRLNRLGAVHSFGTASSGRGSRVASRESFDIALRSEIDRVIDNLRADS